MAAIVRRQRRNVKKTIQQGRQNAGQDHAKGGAGMPNRAFFNLPEDKRDLIVSAAVEEFSCADYDTASINQICKRSNIAKGSFYQYFKDKLDLYVYIMTIAVEKKISFFTTVLDHSKTLTLLEQIRLLFIKGIEFTAEYPQYAALGEQFTGEDNITAKSAVMKEGEKQSELLFAQMIDRAKEKGEVNSTVDTMALSLLLQSLNKTISEYLTSRSDSVDHADKGVDRAKNTNKNEDMIKLVDSLLNIVYSGIRPM